MALGVLVGDGPGLVPVGQPELEHHAEQVGIGLVFHHPLALQPSGGLGGGKFLGLAAGGGGVRPALEGVGDAQNLTGLLVDIGEVQQLVLQVPLEVVHPDHGLVRRRADVPPLPVLAVHPQRGVVGQGDAGARLHQAVNDLLLQAVDGVLLVGDHVHIRVAQQLAVHGHAALQDDGEHPRLVEGDEGGAHYRVALLVQIGGGTGDGQPLPGGDGQQHLLILLHLIFKLLTAAPGASAPLVLPGGLALVRLHGQAVQAAAPGHGLLGQGLGQHLPRLLAQQLPLLLVGCLDRLLDELSRQGPHPAALAAHGLTPGLVVLQVLQRGVVDPAVPIHAPRRVLLIAHIPGEGVLHGAHAVYPPHLRLGLPVLLHPDAVLPEDGVPGGGDFHNHPVHVLNGGEYPGLGGQLLGVEHTHHLGAHGVVGALPVVPLHQVGHAPLDGDGTFGQVVELGKGKPLQFIAQEVLQQLGQPLVLSAAGGDLGLGNGAGHLGLHVFKDDVAHMAGVAHAPVPSRISGHQGPQLMVSVVDALPLVHAGVLGGVGGIAQGQPLLPQLQLLPRLFLVFGLHLHPPLLSPGLPHSRSSISRSPGLARFQSSHISEVHRAVPPGWGVVRRMDCWGRT